MIRVGVIGYGYWGPNLVRNFAEVADSQLVAVADLSAERLAQAAKRYPGIRTTQSALELVRHPSVDAVVIATPVATHFELALEALTHGKHVLVEKPIASSSQEAQMLIEEASRRRLILMAGHTFVFNPAVQKIRELVGSGELGDLYYYDSVRINLGLFQHDVNVLWDLAVHDLAIMDYVLDDRPVAVSASGLAHVPGGRENIAYLTMFFESKALIGHVHVNWLAPVKVRRTLLGGSRRMVVYDDLEAAEKVKVYDKGISLSASPENVYAVRVGYRTGEMWAPNLPVTEALQAEARHFIASIVSGMPPLTDGESGLRVVQLLEAASQSLRAQGRPVELQAAGAAMS
jgi:predicted dehydrogenase